MITRSYAWLLPVALVAAPAAEQPAPDAKVTAVTLTHSAGSARLAIAVEGTVTVRDFSLTDPARLVIDLQGATLEQASAYDGLRRGSVRDVRVRQHEVNVVRVVLEFDRMPAYRVNGATAGVITVAYADEPFDTWQLGARNRAPLAIVPEVTPPPASPEERPSQVIATTGGGVVAGGVPMVSTARAACNTGGTIRVDFQDASWHDVARAFAAVSGCDIVVGAGVEGTVDVSLVNDQPWEYAFHAVLSAYGLSAAELPGGIIRIDSPAKLAELDSIVVPQTQVVRLSYRKAADLVTSMAGMVSSRGRIVADTALNAVYITEAPSRLPGLVDFVESLDIRTPTVAIAAKLVFVDRTDLSQLGFKYDLGTGEQFFNRLIQRIDPLTGQPYNPNTQIVNLGGSAMSAITNADALISGSALDLAFTTAIGGFSVTAFLSALERVELTDIEARPIISTLDNQQAYILSGEETPVRVIDASSFGQQNQAPRANVQFKETGIKLTVTPSVTANREIRMDVEVERSSIQPLAAADLGFTIPKQIARARLLVRDGETFSVGGLTTTTVTRNRAGIPLLSSLPFIGNLFSFTENRESRRDLIVMVTPRIIDDPIE